MNKVTLNNMQMDVHRKSPVYQALLIDLANAGAISKPIAEKLLGAEIPSYIRLPSSFAEKKEEKKPEPSKAPASKTQDKE